MQKPRIFVVEDNSLVALDICQSLSEFGYEVLPPVVSGEAALERISQLHPDVVIMDIRLSGDIDGVTAAAHISDLYQVPIIFLTAHADKATLGRAKIVEPFAYILKPFENIELHAAIQMLLYQNGWEDTALGFEKKVDIRESKITTDLRVDIEFFKKMPFFSQLDEAVLLPFVNSCKLIEVEQGQLIVDPSTRSISTFIVESGRISMIESVGEATDDTKDKQRELILELVEPGDLFGLISALDMYPSKIVPKANRDSRLIMIPKRAFLLILEAYPNLSLSFAKFVASRLRSAQHLARAIAYDDVQTRISSTIDALANRVDSDDEIVTLDLTRKEIAHLTGATVETVVRVLKILETQGQVRLGQRRKLSVRNPKLDTISKIDVQSNIASGKSDEVTLL